jgi:hypothetical protein
MKKCRIRQKTGSAPLWTIFIAILLISFSLLIYTAMSLRSNYLQAQTELERAANVSIDINMQNQSVRDIQITPDLPRIKASLEQNLVDLGYEKLSDTSWRMKKADKTIYSLTNLQLIQEQDQIHLQGELEISLLAGDIATVTIPIEANVQAIFIEY